LKLLFQIVLNLGLIIGSLSNQTEQFKAKCLCYLSDWLQGNGRNS